MSVAKAQNRSMKQKRLVLPGAHARRLMGGQGTKWNCSKMDGGTTGERRTHRAVLKIFMKSKPLVFKIITFVIKVDDRFTALAFKYFVSAWSLFALLRFFLKLGRWCKTASASFHLALKGVSFDLLRSAFLWKHLAAFWIQICLKIMSQRQTFMSVSAC